MLKYMACGRSLLNQQDAVSIGRALSIPLKNVSHFRSDYDITVFEQGDSTGL